MKSDNLKETTQEKRQRADNKYETKNKSKNLTRSNIEKTNIAIAILEELIIGLKLQLFHILRALMKFSSTEGIINNARWIITIIIYFSKCIILVY